jgi:hypothetical protein
LKNPHDKDLILNLPQYTCNVPQKLLLQPVDNIFFLQNVQSAVLRESKRHDRL